MHPVKNGEITIVKLMLDKGHFLNGQLARGVQIVKIGIACVVQGRGQADVDRVSCEVIGGSPIAQFTKGFAP